MNEQYQPYEFEQDQQNSTEYLGYALMRLREVTDIEPTEINSQEELADSIKGVSGAISTMVRAQGTKIEGNFDLQTHPEEGPEGEVLEYIVPANEPGHSFVLHLEPEGFTTGASIVLYAKHPQGIQYLRGVHLPSSFVEDGLVAERGMNNSMVNICAQDFRQDKRRSVYPFSDIGDTKSSTYAVQQYADILKDLVDDTLFASVLTGAKMETPRELN